MKQVHKQHKKRSTKSFIGTYHLGPQLKVVTTMSVGYDHIDLNAAKENQVKIGYTPDVLTDATADLTVLLTLAAARHMKSGIQAAETGEVKL